MPSSARKPWHTLEQEAALPASKADLNRARQFKPFAALVGYYSIIRDRERIVAPRRELQEEDLRELNESLTSIRKGDMVRVRFYDTDCYRTIQGIVTRLDPIAQTITIVMTTIAFADLESIEIIEAHA